jgi:hypothetical protein
MSEAPVLQEPTFVAGEGPNASQVSESESGQQADYFGFQQTHKFVLPDKISWIEFRVMNEGEKADFQDKTSSDMVLERKSGDARMTLKQGTQRHELIKACVVGWNLKRNGTPIPFGRVELADFLNLANPRIVEDLEKEIRKVNPWLLADMTSDDIKQEIHNLEEMLAVKLREEAGEAS